MFTDRYDNPIATTSADAAEAYVSATDILLAGQPGMIAAFQEVTEQDPDFALGWVGLARAHQTFGNMPDALAAMQKAQAVTRLSTEREASHIDVFALLICGSAKQAYPAIRAHVESYPRDAIVAQTCSSVFGLIGFSGQPGREAETLAFCANLVPHYGDDWWALSQYAFALCETGNLAKADALIERSLQLNPDNAHGAHVRAHVLYELGAPAEGLAYLNDWVDGYARDGVLFGHLNWHSALWSMEQGDTDAMWARVDAAVSPDSGSPSPAINILTDTASILHRAALAGIEVSPERWASLSAYAARRFPKTGVAFIDVHAALAHAMAGNQEALENIIAHPAGPARDLVPDLARGFRAIAASDWKSASKSLMAAMADLARLGGSRAQRDLIERSLASALIHQGRNDEARDILALRRPILVTPEAA